MTSTCAPRNTSAQPGDRYGVTSRCLGNDHDIIVAGSWRDVTLPLRKTKQTYPLQTCYEHNMLPLLHAVCLKVLVFFFLSWTLNEWIIVPSQAHQIGSSLPPSTQQLPPIRGLFYILLKRASPPTSTYFLGVLNGGFPSLRNRVPLMWTDSHGYLSGWITNCLNLQYEKFLIPRGTLIIFCEIQGYSKLLSGF